MKKMLLISQVAGLAKEIEETANSPGQISGWNDDALGGFSFSELDDADDDSASLSRVDADKKGAYTGTWSRHGTHHLHQLLDEWEEPDVDRQGEDVRRQSCLQETLHVLALTKMHFLYFPG